MREQLDSSRALHFQANRSVVSPEKVEIFYFDASAFVIIPRREELACGETRNIHVEHACARLEVGLATPHPPSGGQRAEERTPPRATARLSGGAAAGSAGRGPYSPRVDEVLSSVDRLGAAGDRHLPVGRSLLCVGDFYCGT